MKKIICIIPQGQVVQTLEKFCCQVPIINHSLNLYERISKSKYIDKIVIATTKLQNDFEIVKICKK